MANRYAVANGDWSNTATWDGGTLPTSADDVYANNFNVNVNQNIDVISLRNTAGTGITAGGTFTFNTADVTADISNTIVMNPTVSTSFILITASSGLVTLNIPNGSITQITTANSTIILYSGNCNLTITCISFLNNITATPNASVTGILKTSTGNLIINSNLIGKNTFGTNINYVLSIQNNGNVIINGNVTGLVGIGGRVINVLNGSLLINGNVTGGSVNANAIVSTTTETITINGDVINTNLNVTAFDAPFGIYNITGNIISSTSRAITLNGAIMNITGIIFGGSSNGVSSIDVSGSSTLNHIGVAQASAFGSAITCNAPTTSTVTCTGPFLRNGNITAIASQTLRINALSNPYFEFIKSDNSGAIYVETSAANFPAELDVREGTSYASNTLTGTLAVPTPDNVRKGVATDDTVGTADLTAEDFFDAIATSTNDIAIRLRNVATVETTGDQIANL
jgi:hypothetical protein